MRPAVLVVHVVSGTIGLLLGPVAVLLPRRVGWPARAAAVYQVAVASLCASAVGLAVLAPSLWWLGLVAVATEAAAFAGWQVSRGRGRRWRGRHLRLVGGSYIALLTALLVVSVGPPLLWLVPTVIGGPLIEHAAIKDRRRAIGALASV